MRVGIIDHHPVFRMGLATAATAAGFLVCGEGGSRREALDLAGKASILTLALDLPDAGGLDLLDLLVDRHPELRVLVVSMLDPHIYAEQCVRRGAAGYVSKLDDAATFVDALETVRSGEVFLGRRAMRGVLRRLAGGGTSDNPLDDLTPRELEVFRFLSTGASVKSIASHLYLSPKTVESHIAKLKRKLGACSMADLRQRAGAWRLAGTDSRCELAEHCPQRPGNLKMVCK
jgi:DNA-binding NarL/FixJ family response regulator